MKTFTRVITVVLFISFISYNVHAYNLFGGSWSATNVKNLRYTIQGDYQSTWTSSISDWNATDTVVNFTLGTPQNYQVGLGSYIDRNTTTDGYAIVYPNWTSTYTGGFAYLNTHYMDNYVSNARKSVAAHELGHILGLDHESGAVLMNGSTGVRFNQNSIFKPTSDDIDGINALY